MILQIFVRDMARYHLKSGWQPPLAVDALRCLVAGLLTLMMRKNHAGARYWLGLAASAKFLIPFSLLVGIGSRVPWVGGSQECSGI